jgi:serine/threonine protein kinase
MLMAAKTRLGPYEIVAPLGAGGMGEVYQARDTRLDRTVAIKICKGRFTERFEREARAISSLNHQHICALYDIGNMNILQSQTLCKPLKPSILRQKYPEVGRPAASKQQSSSLKEKRPGFA